MPGTWPKISHLHGLDKKTSETLTQNTGASFNDGAHQTYSKNTKICLIPEDTDDFFRILKHLIFPTQCHDVPRCATMCHDVPRCATMCHDVPRCATMCHDVPRCATMCHDVPRLRSLRSNPLGRRTSSTPSWPLQSRSLPSGSWMPVLKSWWGPVA